MLQGDPISVTRVVELCHVALIFAHQGGRPAPSPIGVDVQVLQKGKIAVYAEDRVRAQVIEGIGAVGPDDADIAPAEHVPFEAHHAIIRGRNQRFLAYGVSRLHGERPDRVLSGSAGETPS